MKRLKSYEINQPKDSNAEVIGINYELTSTMYIVEFIRAMSSAYSERRLIRRKFFILVVVAERGERITTANDLRNIVSFKNKQYLEDLQDLEREGYLILKRENKRFSVHLTLSCYEWLSKVLPSFKFIRPKHLIFD